MRFFPSRNEEPSPELAPIETLIYAGWYRKTIHSPGELPRSTNADLFAA